MQDSDIVLSENEIQMLNALAEKTAESAARVEDLLNSTL
jgi:hypothetical protein